MQINYPFEKTTSLKKEKHKLFHPLVQQILDSLKGNENEN